MIGRRKVRLVILSAMGLDETELEELRHWGEACKKRLATNLSRRVVRF